MKDILVSVLIPVYNVEKYLEKCLDSIINQTLSDIEIVCVNDGSTDGSLRILEEYKQRDDRIVIVNKENGGLPSARNAGLDVARGKYVGFVDSDDYVEDTMFQKLYETAESKKSEVVVCGANILPEKPHASKWYYDTLSPKSSCYDECNYELLFQNVSAIPFLWRMFVKKSVIDKNNLRLREDVCLGEDRAFMTKVYLKAKGITFIPNKLYNYYWYREGSMMSELVAEKIVDKVKKHIKLVEHIAEIITETDENTKVEFFKWSIPFVYGDFISLSLEDRKAMIQPLIECLIDFGYYKYRKKFAPWILEQFTYFEQSVQNEVQQTDLSVIISVEGNAEHIGETLEGILNQKFRNVEVILINNGASDWTYSILHKYLFKDDRVRLCNADKMSYAMALNKGLALAKGKYVTFAESNGWYRSDEVLEEWYRFAESSFADVCASVVTVSESNKFNFDYLDKQAVELVNERQYFDSDLYNCLYKKEYIVENHIKFYSCSILTGKIFLMNALLETEKTSYYNRRTYIQPNKIWPTWVSEKKCEKMLRELDKLMQKAVEKRNSNAIAKILTIINGDVTKNILLNSITVHSELEEDMEKNIQIKAIKYLYGIIRHANPQLLQEMGYDMTESHATVLCELMKRRQFRLAEF